MSENSLASVVTPVVAEIDKSRDIMVALINGAAHLAMMHQHDDEPEMTPKQKQLRDTAADFLSALLFRNTPRLPSL